MKYKMCPACSKPWSKEHDKKFGDLYTCDDCGMMYDEFFGTKSLSKIIGQYLIEWDLQIKQSIVTLVELSDNEEDDEKEYKFSLLLPFDISLDRLTTLLIFS